MSTPFMVAGEALLCLVLSTRGAPSHKDMDVWIVIENHLHSEVPDSDASGLSLFVRHWVHTLKNSYRERIKQWARKGGEFTCPCLRVEKDFAGSGGGHDWGSPAAMMSWYQRSRLRGGSAFLLSSGWLWGNEKSIQPKKIKKEAVKQQHQ